MLLRCEVTSFSFFPNLCCKYLLTLTLSLFLLFKPFLFSSLASIQSSNAIFKARFLVLQVWTLKFIISTRTNQGFPCGSAGKESTCNVEDQGQIPGLRKSSGKGRDYPLQYSGLENSMDYIVLGVAKSWTRLSDLHLLTQNKSIFRRSTC